MSTTTKEHSEPVRSTTVRWTVVLLALTGLGCSSSGSGDMEDQKMLDVPRFDEATADTQLGDLLDARIGELVEVTVDLVGIADLDVGDGEQVQEIGQETAEDDCGSWAQCGGGFFQCTNGKIRFSIDGHIPCWLSPDCFAHTPPLPCESGECGTAVCSDDETFLAALFPSGEAVKSGSVSFETGSRPRVRLVTKEGHEEVMVFDGSGTASSFVLVTGTTALHEWSYFSDHATLRVDGIELEADAMELYATLFDPPYEGSGYIWGCNGHLVARLAGGEEVVVSWRPPASDGTGECKCTAQVWGPEVEYVVVWHHPEPPE